MSSTGLTQVDRSRGVPPRFYSLLPFVQIWMDGYIHKLANYDHFNIACIATDNGLYGEYLLFMHLL